MTAFDERHHLRQQIAPPSTARAMAYGVAYAAAAVPATIAEIAVVAGGHDPALRWLWMVSAAAAAGVAFVAREQARIVRDLYTVWDDEPEPRIEVLPNAVWLNEPNRSRRIISNDDIIAHLDNWKRAVKFFAKYGKFAGRDRMGLSSGQESTAMLRILHRAGLVAHDGGHLLRWANVDRRAFDILRAGLGQTVEEPETTAPPRDGWEPITMRPRTHSSVVRLSPSQASDAVQERIRPGWGRSASARAVYFAPAHDDNERVPPLEAACWIVAACVVYAYLLLLVLP